MKNITLAMVAVLAAVAMLSAGLAVPIQEASAWSGGGDGDGGGNSVEIDQKQECERASCSQSLTVYNDQSIED
jgi:opacity protein-like surface antigen